MLLRVAKDYVQLGDVIWDVGANLGIFSFASGKMAGVGGEVVALEPDPELVGLLRASVQLNSDARLAEIRICDCAASASTGFGDLVVASRSRATNHLKGFGTTQTGGERYLERVRTIKLDDLLEDHRSPDVIKIDVEGAEWDVLRGAESSLGNARVVIVEVAGGKGREIHEMLGDLGFQLYDATDPQRGPQDRAVSDSLFLRPSQ
jgi:FkbM family methyltransferase